MVIQSDERLPLFVQFELLAPKNLPLGQRGLKRRHRGSASANDCSWSIDRKRIPDEKVEPARGIEQRNLSISTRDSPTTETSLLDTDPFNCY